MENIFIVQNVAESEPLSYDSSQGCCLTISDINYSKCEVSSSSELCYLI